MTMTIQERYQYNQSRLSDFHGYIFGQCVPPIAELKYGRCCGSVAQKGCGAAAVYNALRYIGRKQPVCEVLREMEQLRMPWIFGLFGTKPFSLRRYFRKNNIPFENYCGYSRFLSALKENSIGIICSWNKRFRGIHFYCVYSENDKLYSLNYYNSQKEEPFDGRETNGLRFITGYVINKQAKQSPCPIKPM